MSKNQKKYIFIFIILIIIAISIYVIYIYSHNLSPTSSIVQTNSTYSKVNDYLSNYKNYNIEILRNFNNILYGTIIDENRDLILFSTYATFSYNTSNDKFNINILENNIRIMDYIVLDNYTYFCTLQYENVSNSFLWNIYKQKNDFEESKELILSGKITDVFDFPVFNYISKDSILVTVNYLINETDLKYEFFEINTSSHQLTSLVNDTYIPGEHKGTILYNSNTIKIYKDKIYYSVLNSDNSQYLLSYDIISRKKQKIYTNEDDNYGILNFVISDNYVFIQLVGKLDTSINLILDTTHSTTYSFESKTLTFPNLINNETILFHNSDNKWDIFQFANMTNNLKEINVWKDTSVFPKYILLDNNTILLQSFDNIFYEIQLLISN